MMHSFSLLSSLFLLISSSFSPLPLVVVISTPLLMRRLTGERSRAEEASAGQARLTGVTLTAASMWKGSVVAAKERVHSLSCSLALSPYLSFFLSLSLLLSAVS